MDQRTEDARRQFEIDARNAHNRRQWALHYHYALPFDTRRATPYDYADFRSAELLRRGIALAVRARCCLCLHRA